jgi:hypothetical protein
LFESKVWYADVVTVFSLQNVVCSTRIRNARGVMSVINGALVKEKIDAAFFSLL